MATVVVNRPDLIEFKNLVPNVTAADTPTFTAQAGVWQANTGNTAGIVVDVSGNEAPLLTAADARKLAKWLTKAADELEGVRSEKKKNKPHRHWENDDDDY